MREHGVAARVGLRISAAFRATAPDPFVIAVLLLAAVFVAGVMVVRVPPGASAWERVGRVADALRDAGTGSHLWSLLAFAMQMCLVLVSGHVLASTPVVSRAIARLAGWPRSGRSAAAMVGVVACGAAVLNWGLGLIVGALLAREVGRSLSSRDVPHHFPLIAAAGYTGMMVWHGGLSGSAPLTMTTIEGARRTLPPDVVDRLSAAGHGSGVPLDETLLTPLNLVVTLGLLLIVPIVLWVLSPKDGEAARHLAGPQDTGETEDASEADGGRVPRWLEESRWVNLVLAGLLVLGLVRFAEMGTVLRLGLNEITAAMLAAGLVLHGSPRRFVRAVELAAGACAGVLIQFPIYAAIIGVMVGSGLARALAEVSAGVGPGLLPVSTMWSAAVLNLFVPSGGGQWAVQGPIALEAGLAAGVEPGRMILAVAYGDQLTNMLQPFWALPLLAITGVRAGEMVGYTCLVMLAGGAWMSLWLAVL